MFLKYATKTNFFYLFFINALLFDLFSTSSILALPMPCIAR